MTPLTKSMNFEFTCTGSRILMDIPHQIWEAQTADGPANTLLTRFFHSRPSFLAENFLRCYLSYLSVDFIAGTFTVLGLLLFLLGLWYLISKRKWAIVSVLLLAPLSPLFEFPADGTWRAVILFAPQIAVMIIGLIQTIFFVSARLRPRKFANQ